MCNNHPTLYLVNINAYTKFDQLLSIHSQDIEQKHNFDINQGPLLYQKLMNRNVQWSLPRFYVHGACTKFDKNPSNNSQDIEHKQNSDVNQGP